CAARTGAVLTRLRTTRVTITGCRTKPRMKRRRLARADFADTFFVDIAEESGRRASDATRRPYHRQRLPYPLLKGEVMRESASREDTAAAPQNPDDASLVLHVLGARPNFVKAAPVVRALAELGIRQGVVDTGQHDDALMSDVFFADLGLPEPIANLGVGSGSHARQTAALLIGLEEVVLREKPDLVVV